MKKILLVLAAIIALGAVTYYGMEAYSGMNGVEISEHGFFAAALGLVLTMIVGFGLMALLFLSNRNGHDEEVHQLHQATLDSED